MNKVRLTQMKPAQAAIEKIAKQAVLAYAGTGRRGKSTYACKPPTSHPAMLKTTSFPSDWLRPAWPAPLSVQAVFTSRAGGVSASPYDSMNLGDHVGDQVADVQGNRALLGRLLQAQPTFLQQVHGRAVVHLPVLCSSRWCIRRFRVCALMAAVVHAC